MPSTMSLLSVDGNYVPLGRVFKEMDPLHIMEADGVKV